ncbi:family 2A encapsulin nanocompartment cargo protein cysteine desulfurase [Nannocystis punicea]|uniref:family 2A encapsulin nanocompartment cargo protein cysteine desulfurase n=1 Tax=Nannocystis punicea TaxID=2995304 RepID=UPI0023E17E6B|nr:family 2A encapsulin nanocompartment cargo protein cysteine desulfurase [Nannocystis poenicansa]
MTTLDPKELGLLTSLLPTASATPTSAAPTPGVALAGARVPGAPTVPDFDPAALATMIGRMANDMFAAPPAPAELELELGPGARPDVEYHQYPPSPELPGAPTTTPAPAARGPAAAVPAAGPASSPVPAQSLEAPSKSPQSTASAQPPILSPSPQLSAPTATQSPFADAAPSEWSQSPFAAPLRFDGLGEVELGALAETALESVALLDGVVAVPEVAPEGSALYWLPATSAAAPAIDLGGFEAHEFSPLAGPTLRGPGVFDPYALRREFPLLQERVHGKPLVWLDNAATTQKPQAVIDRLARFYERENSNIHRAAHTLAARATDAYESARESVRRFLHASSTREVVFVRGASEGINLVAQSWGRRNVGAGDEVVITWLEHHANIVPWQLLCAERGARLRVAPVDDTGQIVLEEYEKLLNPRTRLVALPQVSNALGTVTPARAMIEMAHRHGAVVLLDGAQAVSHMAVDVQQLDCDFYVFSGHKVFGPTGIGVVFGKQALLDAMPPWQGGGNMIQDVTFERTTYHPAPARFEAGTGNIADAVGLGAALEWLVAVGLDNVARHEHDLLVYATERLATVPGLTMIGTAPGKAGVLSFVLAGQKTEEVGGLLDREGIAVRSGHHCAQPILRRFGVEATVRASLAPYNTCEDIDALVAALRRLQSGRPGQPAALQ